MRYESDTTDGEWLVMEPAVKHVNGFAVRLHNLGDFYSVEYVELWRKLLERHEKRDLAL